MRVVLWSISLGVFLQTFLPARGECNVIDPDFSALQWRHIKPAVNMEKVCLPAMGDAGEAPKSCPHDNPYSRQVPKVPRSFLCLLAGGREQ